MTKGNDNMHNIGPYNVENGKISRHGREVSKPAMLIMDEGDICYAFKAGDAEYISVCYNRYLRTKKEFADMVHFITFDVSKISIDAICTLFNASMNSVGSSAFKMLIKNDAAGVLSVVESLQMAGY